MEGERKIKTKTSFLPPGTKTRRLFLCFFLLSLPEISGPGSAELKNVQQIKEVSYDNIGTDSHVDKNPFTSTLKICFLHCKNTLKSLCMNQCQDCGA